jgi:hypothetical protein
MEEIVLTIQSPEGVFEVAVEGDLLTLGRGDLADVTIEDGNLSRIHASIHREGDAVWICDEGSTNGSFVNGEPVPERGVSLVDGDEIVLGEDTRIAVRVAAQASAAGTRAAPPTRARSRLLLVEAAVVAVIVVVAGVFALWALGSRADDSEVAGAGPEPGTAAAAAPRAPTSAPEPPAPAARSSASAPPAPAPIAPPPPSVFEVPLANRPRTLYLQMTPEQQREYLDEQAQRVALMVGNRPCAFTDGALDSIKHWLDAYARRVGNNSTRIWGEDMRFLFKRARGYAPLISRAFNERGVAPVIGLYLPVIETEYRNIPTENFAGAAGLFQFIGPTARAYGVDPSERTNVEKMAPAAARYIADRLAEFGPDAVGVGLSIAGYNRNPDSVRRDLQSVLDSDNRERSFWTLVANKGKLNESFQNENVFYVPRFFAAAIIGENPWAFGLDMRPLSTYTDSSEVEPATGTQ